MNKGIEVKGNVSKFNPKEFWKDDEQLLCKNKQCKFKVQYLGSIGLDDDEPEVLCKKAMTILLEKKRRNGDLKISVYSLIFQDKYNNALILDQTLKKVILCASYVTVPYSFYYIAEDPEAKISQLYGFISCKEVSNRIVNAIEFAIQLFDEKQSIMPVIHDFSSHSNNDESDTTFKQASLAEKYWDPQSSIVIHSTPLKCSRTLPELKSIPRPRGSMSSERKLFDDSFKKLNQDDMFKTNEILSKSADVKQGFTTNEELREVFGVRTHLNDVDFFHLTTDEKLQRIHRINEEFHKSNTLGFGDSFSDRHHTRNGSDHTSRYDSLKQVNSEAAIGWSADLVQSNENSQTNKTSSNQYIDNIVIPDFFQTNPFNSPNCFSRKQ